jgi:hypothetical protein
MSIVNFTYQKTEKSIGGFEIDATITEGYKYVNQVTEFPVEDGSNVNDHVISEAAEISIQAFIGQAKFEVWDGAVPESMSDLPDEDPKARIMQAYYELLKLKEDRQPLTLIIGLGTFENMVITSFEIDRDVKTGKDLPFSMTFKQVRIVKSETVGINATSDQVASVRNRGIVNTNKMELPTGKGDDVKDRWRQMHYGTNGKIPTKEEFFEEWGTFP